MKRLLNNNKRKAFTLIELLVVIAIIGILSGAVIVAMSGTQESATDSRIKVSMDQLRSSIEIYALLNGSNYGGLESDREVSLLLSDIVSQGVTPTVDVSVSGDKYCLSADLKSSNDKWCIDSTGFAGIGDCLNQACNYALGEGGGEEDLPVVWSCENDFIDPRDSNVYSTVQIGDQCWMAENLNYATGTSWCYNNSTTNCDTYGRLYNWDTAQTVCPAGWHLPTDTEQGTLTNTTGTLKQDLISAGFFNNIWPGYRDHNGYFRDINVEFDFWSSSLESSAGIYRNLRTDYNTVRRLINYTSFGLPVRCLKD